MSIVSKQVWICCHCKQQAGKAKLAQRALGHQSATRTMYKPALIYTALDAEAHLLSVMMQMPANPLSAIYHKQA